MKTVKKKSLFLPKKKIEFKDLFSGLCIKVTALRKCNPSLLSSVEKLARKVLKNEKINAARLNLILADSSFLKSLNWKFLSKNSATDVLSFDLKLKNLKTTCLFGDVFICVDIARSFSKKLDISFQEELCRYMIHGLLHLLGYDDQTEKKRRKMWKRQEELLDMLKT